MAEWQILDDNPRAKPPSGGWQILDDEPKIPGMEKLGSLPGAAGARVDMQPQSLAHPIMRMGKDAGNAAVKAATTPIAQSLNDTLGIDRKAPSIGELYDQGVEGLSGLAGKAVDTVAGAGTYSRIKQDFGDKVAAINEIPRAAAGLLDFGQTPAGMATIAAAPVMAASPALGAAVGAGFSASMAPDAMEAAKHAYEDPTAQNVVKAAIGAGMTLAPLAHPAAKYGRRAVEGKPVIDTSQPETVRRPATPEGMQALAAIETNPEKLAALREDAVSARQEPAVPVEGIPEDVARAVDARDRIAMQVAGEPFAELSNPDTGRKLREWMEMLARQPRTQRGARRLAVDQLVTEGYSGDGGASAAAANSNPRIIRKPKWEVLPDEPNNRNADNGSADQPGPIEAQRGRQDVNAANTPAEAPQEVSGNQANAADETQPEVLSATQPDTPQPDTQSSENIGQLNPIGARPNELSSLPANTGIGPTGADPSLSRNPKLTVDQGLTPEATPEFSSEVQTAPQGEPATSERISEVQPPSATGPAPVIRDPGERGSFSLRTPAPLTPGEQYAEELAVKREEARNKPGLIDKAKGLVSQAKTKLIDFNAPIEDLLAKAKKNGAKIEPTNDIEHQIDMSLRAPMLAGQFIQDHGFDDLLKDVDNPEYIGQYLTAKQARTVSGNGMETGRDAVKDAALVSEFQNRVAIPATGKTPAVTYEQVAQKVNGFSRSLLDYAVDSGLVSNDLAAHLKQAYPDYVPMKRVFEVADQMNNQGTGTGHASLSSQSLVQRLNGSEREIENPLESILGQVSRTFAEGEKNKAGEILAGYGQTIPEFQAVIQEVTGEPGTHPHTFTFRDNGVKRTFQTTPEIAAAAKALNVQQMNVWGQILALPVRIAKVGITGVNPAFGAANVVRDQLMAATTARTARTFSPEVVMKALTGATGRGDLYQEMVRNGAGGTSFDIARNAPGESIAALRSHRSIGARAGYVARNPSELLRMAEDLVGRSEEFTRLQQYEAHKQAALAAGASAEDAAIIGAKAARSNTANFSRRGEWGTVLNSTILYLNAGIQGARSHIRAFESGNYANATARVAGTVLLPVITATLWNLSDPKRAAAYKDIEKYERENNVILVPDNPTQDERGRWNVIKAPMAPGISQLATPIRRAIEAMHGMDPVRTAEVANSLISSVSPIDPEKNKLLSALTPQAIRPSLESYSNTDFFTGMPVVPDRMKNLPVDKQVFPYTSGTARKIAGAVGQSPVSTEHFIKGTFGGVGAQALHFADKGLAAAGVIPEDQVGGESIPAAIAARFNKARGGAESRKQFEGIRVIEQEHAGKVADKKAGVEKIFADLQTMPPADVAVHLSGLMQAGQLDAAGMKTIAKMAAERANKLTPFERSLAHQPTEVRAKFAIQELRKAAPGARAGLIKDWATRGIINQRVLAEVAQQLQPQ